MEPHTPKKWTSVHVVELEPESPIELAPPAMAPVSTDTSDISQMVKPPDDGSLHTLEIDSYHQEDSSFWTDFSDSESMYNSSDSALESFRWPLATRLLQAYTVDRQSNVVKRPTDQANNKRMPATSHGKGDPANRPNTSARPRLPKRMSSDDTDQDQDGNKPIRRKVNPKMDDSNQRLLACPYCKHDPRTYRDCQGKILREIWRLKYVVVCA